MKYLNQKLLLFIFLLPLYFYAQGLSPIVNYTPKDYSGENQNWQIDQSVDNYVYIGNNSGLLEFNGATWKLYPSINNSNIKSVKVINNKVFTGCYMDFGFWEKNSFGNLIYNSLVTQIGSPLLDDETFWNILHFDDYVLFQSLNRIYVYNLKSKSFKIIQSNTKRAMLFKVGNYIYFQKSNEGLFRIENGKAILVSNSNLVLKNEIVGAFLINKKPLFLTELGGFYFLEGENFIKWNIKSEEILKPHKIYSSLKLSDNSFILGTISNGIYHISDQGEFIQNINKEKGLLNNTVLCVFEDKDKNVWLGLDNGICTININSPFNVFNDIKGEIGSVYSSVIHNNILYLGTNQGLFYTALNTYKQPKLIENTHGQVWRLRLIGNTLFCGHNVGTFIIDNNKAVKISDFPGTWDIKEIKSNKNLLLQGNYNGLSVLEKVNNKWQFRNKIEGFDISSRFFEFISDNELIINHEYKGIFQLKLNKLLTKITNKIKYEPLGEESSLVSYKNLVLHSSSKGVYSFSTSTNTFVKDTLLSPLLYNKKDPIEGNLIVTGNKLWGFSNKNIAFVTYDALSNTPKRINVPVQKSYRSSNIISGFENLNLLFDDNYLIGNTSGFTVLNVDRLQTKNYQVSINSIYNQELNYDKEQLALNKLYNLKANENNLYISYSVPEFDKNTEVSYQYRLKGFYNKWGEWTSEPSVVFKNLPYGNYTFQVKARIGNTISENIAEYTFEIDRPWYLSNVAIVIYTLACVVLFLLIHNFYRRYYTRQKKVLVEKKQREFALSKLESDKVIMKLKNEKLQNEVEGKTRELSASTMSIIKKNELLNTIKKELLGLKSKVEIAPVIKIINKNISTNSDWEMFQEAFNNADTDFLKKVKEIHPNLTPNDLRLCAYLRLNLSSKEIAPLLNISPRSVEIKRYRLRKKMELVHEKSLVEYILNM